MVDKLMIVCYGNTRAKVEDLINYAIGEGVVSKTLDYIYDPCNFAFRVMCKDQNEKYCLVNYIYEWLDDKSKERVKFYNKKDKPDIDFRTAAANKTALDHILEDWK